MDKKNYWKDDYGKRSNEFIEGVIVGVKAFAVWDKGEQCVGALRRNLNEEIADIKEGMGYITPPLDDEPSEQEKKDAEDHEKLLRGTMEADFGCKG